MRRRPSQRTLDLRARERRQDKAHAEVQRRARAIGRAFYYAARVPHTPESTDHE